MYKILICDDQPDIVNALKIYLAPEGYTLLKEAAFEGTLPADTLELRVVNGEAFALPKTGSTGFVHIPMATVLCLLLCAANLWLLRKKEQ